MTPTLRRRTAAVLLLLAGVVLATDNSCDPPLGDCVNGCEKPWGDPAKGQFSEFVGGAR